MTRTIVPTGDVSGSKILRACVIQNGRVIEEKRLYSRESLSIGSSARNTFAIADPALPKTRQLFLSKSGEYELVFTEGMRGKLSVDGSTSPRALSSFKDQEGVKKKGSFYYLPLSDKHRGKVMIGDLTLIFQFVVPPPVRPKLELPPGVKGTFLQKIDWPFALCILACMLIELPMIVYFHYVPKPDKVEFDLASIDSRWAELIVPEFQPKAEKPKPKPNKNRNKLATTGKSSVNKAKQERQLDRGDKASGDKAKVRAAKSKKIRDKIAGKGILALLGTKGTGGAAGVVADVFRDGGDIGGDLDSSFEGIAGVGLATTSNSRTQRGGGSGKAASIAALATSGGGRGKVKAAKRERVVGSVEAERIEDLDGALDASKIARVIRRQSSGIQRCFETELKRSPTLSGKLEIEITIGENGRVEEASILTNSLGSAAVAKCAVSRIRRWRFPKPTGGSVTFVAPFNFISSS